MGRAAGWLEGEALDALAALLLAAPTRKLPSDVLCTEDAGAAQYCAKAWEAVKAYEDSHPQVCFNFFMARSGDLCARAFPGLVLAGHVRTGHQGV